MKTRRRSIRRPSSVGVSFLSTGSLSSGANSPVAGDDSQSPRKSSCVPNMLRPPFRVKACLLFKDPADALSLENTTASLDPIESSSAGPPLSCLSVADGQRDDALGKIVRLSMRQQLYMFDIDAVGDSLVSRCEDSVGGQLLELSAHFAAGQNVALLHAGQRMAAGTEATIPEFLFSGTEQFGCGNNIMTVFLEATLRSLAPPPRLLVASSTNESHGRHAAPQYEIMCSLFCFAEGKVRDLTVLKDEASVYQRVPV
jgi:hypothetical protein